MKKFAVFVCLFFLMSGISVAQDIVVVQHGQDFSLTFDPSPTAVEDPVNVGHRIYYYPAEYPNQVTAMPDMIMPNIIQPFPASLFNSDTAYVFVATAIDLTGGQKYDPPESQKSVPLTIVIEAVKGKLKAPGQLKKK
jgi:hypothetical protein